MRSLKGMYFIKLKIPRESLHNTIIENLQKKHVIIEQFERHSWNKQLYLVYSYITSYDGQSSYLLVGDTTDEGEEPEIKVYIGPFSNENKKLQKILETSIIKKK